MTNAEDTDAMSNANNEINVASPNPPSARRSNRNTKPADRYGVRVSYTHSNCKSENNYEHTQEESDALRMTMTQHDENPKTLNDERCSFATSSLCRNGASR